MDLVYQLFGYVGLILMVLSFQSNKRAGIIYYQLLSSLFYFLHFFMIGALTGAFLNLLGIARSYIFFKRDNVKWASSNAWPIVFISAFSIAGLFTYSSLISLLPLFSVLSGTLATWSKNEKIIRITFLISRPCWLIYNYANGSLPGIITEIILTVSILIGIIRYDITCFGGGKKNEFSKS